MRTQTQAVRSPREVGGTIPVTTGKAAIRDRTTRPSRTPVLRPIRNRSYRIGEMARSWRRRGRRIVDEQGVALVEAAIFTPIIMFLLLGCINAGLVMGDHTSLSWATRSGARAASAAGADALADYDVLHAVSSATSMYPRSAIDRIVVFDASGYDDQPSESCKAGSPHAGSGIGSCNVYVPSDFDRHDSAFNQTAWGGDLYWPGVSRQDTLSVGPDYVGVWVQAHCTCLPQVFGFDGVMHSTTVMRIEARRV